MAGRPTATIELMATHSALLTPPVAEVRRRLARPVTLFAPGGPLGHVSRAVALDDFTPLVPRHKGGPLGLLVPQGLVAPAAGWLRELGYAVRTLELRKDSPRWVRADGWEAGVAEAARGAVAALAGERSLRVVAAGEDAAADVVAGVARAYPAARVAVAVPTVALLDRFAARLQARAGERLGHYGPKLRRPGRVAVGLVRQFPLDDRRGEGDWDVLALPYAEATASDDAIRLLATRQYRRVLSFAGRRWTGDPDLDLRLKVFAATVYPPRPGVPPVTAVVLAARGGDPGPFADALDAKRALYWHNARRNRRVAQVARALALSTRKSTRSVVGDPDLASLTRDAAAAGVAVLVEGLPHARELAGLLPGWAVVAAGGDDGVKPDAGCGVIVTELAARAAAVDAGVLVRATGTRWPLPDLGWPRPGAAERGVLIDFADAYHPVAARDAAARREGYREGGMAVRDPPAADD